MSVLLQNAATALEQATKLQFDYSQIDEAHREKLMADAVAYKQRAERIDQDLLKNGEIIVKWRGILEHGQFSAWVEKELDISPRQAQMLMNTWEVFRGKSEIISLLGDTNSQLLAAPSVPEAAREQVIAEAKKTGTKPTQAKVKAAITQHRQTPRALTVVECEKMIVQILEHVSNDAPAQLEALTQHTEMEDYTASIGDESVTMRRKEFDLAYKKIKRWLSEQVEKRSAAVLDSEQAVARSNARTSYVAPEQPETPLEHAFVQEPSTSADAPETTQGASVAQAEQPELTAHECRQRDIQIELDFWREALRRVDRIGELIGIYKHSAPIRREIEPAIKLLKENLLP